MADITRKAYYVSPTMRFTDAAGLLTADGFRLMKVLAEQVQAITLTVGEVVEDNIADGAVGIEKIATASKTGDAAKLVTGASGGENELASWDASGNAAASGVFPTDILVTDDIGVEVQAYALALDEWAVKARPTGDVVGTTDAQTLSNKIFTTPAILPVYTVAGLPAAASHANGVVIVSDEVGGRTLATSDGTDWRRVSDGAIAS